jgi:hypothetical protein
LRIAAEFANFLMKNSEAEVLRQLSLHDHITEDDYERALHDLAESKMIASGSLVREDFVLKAEYFNNPEPAGLDKLLGLRQRQRL